MYVIASKYNDLKKMDFNDKVVIERNTKIKLLRLLF